MANFSKASSCVSESSASTRDVCVYGKGDPRHVLYFSTSQVVVFLQKSLDVLSFLFLAWLTITVPAQTQSIPNPTTMELEDILESDSKKYQKKKERRKEILLFWIIFYPCQLKRPATKSVSENKSEIMIRKSGHIIAGIVFYPHNSQEFLLVFFFIIFRSENFPLRGYAY